MTGVPPLDRLVIALVDVETLGALSAVVKGATVARLAAAVVPTGHVETGGRLMAPVQVTRALVKV